MSRGDEASGEHEPRGARLVRVIVPRIRGIADELGCSLHLRDTQGPAIRTGDLPAKLDLKPARLRVTGAARRARSFTVSRDYDGLIMTSRSEIRARR